MVNASAAVFVDGTNPWTYVTTSGYGGDIHNAVKDTGGPILSTCTWTPDLPAAGDYKVYAWWTSHSNRAKNVPYGVHHGGGDDTVLVNQELGEGGWQYLGTYYFDAGTSGYVEISDNAEVNEYVMADAVLFEPQE